MGDMSVAPVVRLEGVAVVRDGAALLDDIDLDRRARASAGPCSDPTARARPRCCGWSAPACGRPGGRSRSWANASAGSTCASSADASPW